VIARAATLLLGLGFAAPALAGDAALVFVSGSDVMTVPVGTVQAVTTPDVSGQLAVMVTLDKAQAELFAGLTGRHIGEIVEVRVCDELAVAPRVMERIAGGAVMISGNFTDAEAADLARRITASDCEGFSSPFTS
jgi:preprotein translocase subunit SecD